MYIYKKQIETEKNNNKSRTSAQHRIVDFIVVLRGTLNATG